MVEVEHDTNLSLCSFHGQQQQPSTLSIVETESVSFVTLQLINLEKMKHNLLEQSPFEGGDGNCGGAVGGPVFYDRYNHRIKWYYSCCAHMCISLCHIM